MFAHLEDYKSEDFYKKHKSIELETLQGHEDYEIIAAFTTPVYTGHDFEYYNFAGTDDEAEFNNYVRQCKEKSIYKIDKSATFGQRLLTLSTCEYSHKNGRMVIVAAQIDKHSGGQILTLHQDQGLDGADSQRADVTSSVEGDSDDR